MNRIKDIRLNNELSFAFLILLAINIACIMFFDRDGFRYPRLLSVLVFAIYIGSRGIGGKRIVMFFLVLALMKQFSVLFYEYTSGFIGYFIFGILCYLLIIFQRKGVLKKVVARPLNVLGVFIFLSVNCYAVYLLSSAIEKDPGVIFFPSLFFIYSIVALITASVAALYNALFNSNRSLLYLYAVFAFVLADICSLLDYYFGFSGLAYLEITFYLLALVLYLIFAMNNTVEVQEKEQLELLNIVD